MVQTKIFLKLILIFVIQINYSNAQDIYIKKDLFLTNKSITATPDLRFIEKLNYNFDGYLIVEIDTSNKETKNFYYCKIYWVDSLVNINFVDGYKYFHFLSHWMQINATLIPNDSLQEVGFIFSNVYNALNSDTNCQSYLNNLLKDALNTNILSDIRLWNYKNSTIAVFECSFRTAIVGASVSLNRIKEIWKIFVPISKLYKFKEVDEDVAKHNNLISSKRKIKLAN